MLHQTTEYQLAIGSGRPTPTARVELTEDHSVQALSLDGACKLAVQVALQFRVTIVNVGATGGCYTCDEQEALQKFNIGYDEFEE